MVLYLLCSGPDGKLGGDSKRLQEELDEQRLRKQPLLCTEWRRGSLDIVITNEKHVYFLEMKVVNSHILMTHRKDLNLNIKNFMQQ